MWLQSLQLPNRSFLIQVGAMFDDKDDDNGEDDYKDDDDDDDANKDE
jgi:hypothetical protein